MTKAEKPYPMETRNVEQLSQRIERDLIWVLFSTVAATAAAVISYMLIKPA